MNDVISHELCASDFRGKYFIIGFCFPLLYAVVVLIVLVTVYLRKSGYLFMVWLYN